MRYLKCLLFSVLLAGSAVLAADADYPYIATSIPVDGFIQKLIISQRTPHVLYALVGTDGAPKATDRPGVYVFDISEPLKPQRIAYWPVVGPRYLEINSVQNRLLVTSAHMQGNDANAWYGLQMLDISDPLALKPVGRIGIYAAVVQLSADGNYAFIPNEGDKSNPGSFLTVLKIPKDGDPTVLARVATDNSVYGIFLSPDGRYLMSHGSGDDWTVYDVTNPELPRKIYEVRNWLGYPLANTSDGVLLLSNGDDLVLAKGYPKLLKLGELAGELSNATVTAIDSVNKLVYLTTIDKTLHIVDINNARRPYFLRRYLLPNYIRTAVSIQSRGIIYVGMPNELAVIDRSLGATTASRLIAGHTTALSEDESSLPRSSVFGKRVSRMQAAGIDDVLNGARPDGISTKRLAHVVNDYGYFLAGARRHVEAIRAFNLAIELDSSRAVAYLNLGDSLRETLSAVESFDEKHKQTEKIVAAYKRYRQLGGKSQRHAEDFMAFNIVSNPPKDACSYIADYRNRGRMSEVFGLGNSITRVDGVATMRVSIRYDGTAHFPAEYFFDVETEQPLYDTDELGVTTESERFSQRISIVPFKNGHYMLRYDSGEYLLTATPLGKARNSGELCDFEMQMTEQFEGDGSPAFCGRLHTSSNPEYIDFTTTLSLSLPRDDTRAADISVLGVGFIDFDNDGEKEWLASLRYESGAGPGCTYNYFDLLNGDRTALEVSEKRARLLALQSVVVEGESLRMPRCRGNFAGWFRDDGVTYYETHHRDQEPRNDEDEFHNVAYLKDGQLMRACNGIFKQLAKSRY